MKLLLENWKKYLNESEVQEEGWKDIAMAGALGLSSIASPAQAADVASSSDAPTMQADAEVSSEADDFNAALGFLKAYIDSKDSTKEKRALEFKLMNVQKALDKAADGDSSMLNSLGKGEASFLDSVMEKINKFKTQDLELYDHYKDAGSRINIR